MFFPQLFVEKSGDVSVIYGSESLVHAGHDANVVIVDLIYFLQVEELRQVTLLVREYEVCYCLRDEGRREQGLHRRLGLWDLVLAQE
jgi:hypothetical protein